MHVKPVGPEGNNRFFKFWAHAGYQLRDDFELNLARANSLVSLGAPGQ